MKRILIVILIPFFLLNGSETCDSICQSRIQQFLSQQMNPLINEIGKVLNILYPVSGPIQQQIQIYHGIIGLFSLFFGMNDQSFLAPLDQTANIATQVETIKARAATIYAALKQKSPNQTFQNYTWIPIGSHGNKKGTIIISNNTDIPWYLNDKKINAQQKNVSIEIETPALNFFLKEPEKTTRSSLGTWFKYQPAYDQEVYSINKKDKKFILRDESLKKDFVAIEPAVINIENIV